MEQRTLNIINICKGNTKYTYNNTKTYVEAIADYMSEECDCPISTYTPSNMFSIMMFAFKDYMRTCDNPSFVIFELQNLVGYDQSTDKLIITSEKIATVFSLQGVRNDSGGYVNGFDENLNLLDRKF